MALKSSEGDNIPYFKAPTIVYLYDHLYSMSRHEYLGVFVALLELYSCKFLQLRI